MKVQLNKIHHFHTTNDCSIAYRLTGNPNGVPILFFNGILMNLDGWKPQSEFLKEYLCITLDFRGQLRSGKEFPDHFTMGIHVQDTKELMAHLGIPQFNIVGTSYGGEVALLYVLTYPEQVKSITVIASVSYSDMLLKHQVSLWKNLASVSTNLLYDCVMGLCYSDQFISQNEALLTRRKEAFQQLPESFFKGFEKLCDAFIHFQLSNDQLQQIVCPALIVSAQLDILKLPHYSEAMVENLPNAQYEKIEGAGHAVTVEHPNKISELVERFLSNL